MTRQAPPLQADNYLRQGSFQNSTFEETLPRTGVADTAISATGVAHATPIPLQAGDVVSNITFVTAGTAAATPTAGFVALYDSAAVPALLAQSADLSTTARAANTAYTIPLASAVTITKAGLYWVSISFTAGTIPSLWGATVGGAELAAALVTGQELACQSHGAAVGGTAPATLVSVATLATPCYFLLT